jgi:hypothetical protein
VVRFAFGLVDAAQLAPSHTISEYVLLICQSLVSENREDRNGGNPKTEKANKKEMTIMMWVDNDLTALAGASLATSVLDGDSQGDGSQHVKHLAWSPPRCATSPTSAQAEQVYSVADLAGCRRPALP